METFNYKLTTESSGEIEHKINETSFGDGYVQATSVGINNKMATWAVTAVGKSSYTRPIINFFDRHKGAISFYWTPPEGEQGRYRVSKYKLQNMGGDNFRLSATFTQSYGIDAKPPTGTNVLSVNGEAPDEYGDVKLAAGDIGAEVEGTAKEAITALKKEDNPFAQYAKQTDLNKVKTTANAAATKTELEKTNNKVASLEKIKPVLSINNSLPDETGNIDFVVGGDATEQINAAITALKKEDNPFDQYALQESLNKVEKTANTSATQEELKKTNQKVKALEDKKIVLTINDSPPDEKGNVTIPAGVSIKDTVKANDSTWSSEQIDKAIQEDNKVPLFSVAWWPDRNNIPLGYTAADGTLLTRAVYPQVATALDNGIMPQVSNAVWLSDPSKRGCYVANDGNGNFRLPDYNGVQTNSVGGLFVRGGKNTDIVDGTVQKDAIRNITGYVGATGAYESDLFSNATGAFTLDNAEKSNYKTTTKAANNPTDKKEVYFDASKVVTVADENRPINVSGCWIIKLFGSVSNASSLDASALALSIASLSTRISLIEDALVLEKSNSKFIYPNEGTEDNPKEIVNNTRYVLDNPFPEAKYVECVALVLFDGKWGSTPYIYSSGSFGVSATHFGDKIILQTGTNFLLTTGQAQGNPFGNISNQTKLPCKVFIKKVM